MGCDVYNYQNANLLFADIEELVCLCTFPANDEIEGKLSPEKVRAMAALGAAIAMIHHRDLVCNDWLYLPDGLPEWIWQEIKRLIPILPAP